VTYPIYQWRICKWRGGTVVFLPLRSKRWALHRKCCSYAGLGGARVFLTVLHLNSEMYPRVKPVERSNHLNILEIYKKIIRNYRINIQWVLTDFFFLPIFAKVNFFRSDPRLYLSIIVCPLDGNSFNYYNLYRLVSEHQEDDASNILSPFLTLYKLVSFGFELRPSDWQGDSCLTTGLQAPFI